VLIEDQSTKCPKCKNDLTWKSHEKIWTKERELDQFTFICNSCSREYLFKDDVIIEKTHGRDPVAESTAICHLEIEAALARRCPECGGPLNIGYGLHIFHCEWCQEKYQIDGELVPKPPEPLPRKTLREYAVRSE
jgi:uncharacterized protein YbaR (Trm112 family)